jgi:hypothetical protein
MNVIKWAKNKLQKHEQYHYLIPDIVDCMPADDPATIRELIAATSDIKPTMSAMFYEFNLVEELPVYAMFDNGKWYLLHTTASIPEVTTIIE